MTLTFIRHELKAFWRSKNTGKAVTVHIIMAVLILYLLACVSYVAFQLDTLLAGAFPDEDLIAAFSGIILYYFIVDLLLRFQLQELPTLSVQPYLHLPIPKNTVVRYLSFVSLKSVFNLWPIILFTPFILKVMRPEQGPLMASLFMLSIIGLAVFNNYFSLYVKRRSNLNGWISIGFAVFLILLTMSDFSWHIFSFRKISFLFFGHLAAYHWLVLLPVVLPIGMYYINFLYLKQNLYLEELGSRKTSYKSSTNIPFLNRFGQVGDLVANEIKLILRNKRTKSSIISTAFILSYGLLFYPNKHLGDGFKMFCGLMMSGVFMMNYGQFMFGWQGAFFDGILVSKVNFRDFLRAKYILFTLISSLAFLLTTPYVYFGWRILLLQFIMYLWNIGVNTTLILFFANRNYKRIDLSKKASFNWEGVGATQLLLSLPFLLLPYCVYTPFAVFNHPGMGLIIISIIAVTFLFTRPYWIKQLEADFYEKKYTIAEGFRNK